MRPAISVEEAVFSWEGSAFELRVPSFVVERGAAAAVVGPSGSGKTTLLGLLSGERVARSGAVWVAGVEQGSLTPAARRAHRLAEIGLVFQDFPLVPYLGALDNVLLPYRIGPLRLDGAARERAVSLLDELGLASMHTRRPDRLSQGERQRVAIARALVTEPRVLLADEPTAGLDPARAAEVVELLLSMGGPRGATVVVVTHDPAVRARFSHVLDLGRVQG